MGQTLLNGNNIAMVCLLGLASSTRPINEMEDVLIEQLIPGGQGPKA
jgi:hypothetical protein